MLMEKFSNPARTADEPEVVQRIIDEQAMLRESPDQEGLNFLSDAHFFMGSNYERALTAMAETLEVFCDAYDEDSTRLNINAIRKLITHMIDRMDFIMSLDRQIKDDYTKPDHPWRKSHNRFMRFLSEHDPSITVVPIAPGYTEI